MKASSSSSSSSRKKMIVVLSLFLIAIIPVYYYYYLRSNNNNNNNSYSSKLAAAYNSLNIGSLNHNNIPAPSPTTTLNTSADQLLYSNEEEAAGTSISNDDDCDLSLGEWVSNPEAPYYTNTTCSHIQDHQNCMKYGRPDTAFLKWRWKPQGPGCHDLPIFHPLQFLEMMTGKKMAFIGDSVARNHMQSLICLLSNVEEAVEVSNTSSSNAWSHEFKRFHYTKHNFTIAMFWSPYLVRTSQDTTSQKHAQNLPYDLFLDEPDPQWTQEIHAFNYIIISAGQWFSRPATFYIQNRVAGCLYCPQSNITHLTSNFSYRHAFRTAFRAIAQQTNFSGITFLRSFVPSHFENGNWNEGGDCVRQRPYRPEESPLEGYIMEFYQIQLEELKIAQQLQVLGDQGRRRLKFRMIDVTRAMLMRPDGHPSKYGRWSPLDVSKLNDCVHWCLPGPVDSWNDFLIQLLRREQVQVQVGRDQ